MPRFAPRNLQCESLEDRCLMAGDASAYMANGDLMIVEDFGQYGASQGVEIRSLGNNQVRVRGMQIDNGPATQISGAAYRDFTVTGNIIINLGGGNDTAWFADGGTYNSLTITTGLEGLKAKGPDQDTVYIGKITTRGGVNINTGNDNDGVTIVDAIIGNDSSDNLNVQLGKGIDSFYMDGAVQTAVVFGNLYVQTFESLSETFNDAVFLSDTSVLGNCTVNTAAGSDFVEFKRMYIGGDLSFNTGDGRDFARIETVRVIDDILARLGDGTDQLDIDNISADQMDFFGEGGNDDTLNFIGSANARLKNFTGWERGNGAAGTNNFGDLVLG